MYVHTHREGEMGACAEIDNTIWEETHQPQVQEPPHECEGWWKGIKDEQRSTRPQYANHFRNATFHVREVAQCIYGRHEVVAVVRDGRHIRDVAQSEG